MLMTVLTILAIASAVIWIGFDFIDRRDARSVAWALKTQSPSPVAVTSSLQWQLATGAVSRSVAVYALCRVSGVTPLEAREQLGIR